MSSKEAWHEWAFWLGGALTVVLIVIQTHLNEKTQKHLETEIATIRRNTESTLRPVGMHILDPRPTAGEPLRINVDFRIVGNGSLKSVFIFPFSPLVTYEKALMDPEAEKTIKRQFSAEVAHQKELISSKTGQDISGGLIFETVQTSALSKEQIEHFFTRKTRLYVLTWSSWKTGDATESNETCQWLQKPTSNDLSKESLVWVP